MKTDLNLQISCLKFEYAYEKTSNPFLTLGNKNKTNLYIFAFMCSSLTEEADGEKTLGQWMQLHTISFNSNQMGGFNCKTPPTTSEIDPGTSLFYSQGDFSYWPRDWLWMSWDSRTSNVDWKLRSALHSKLACHIHILLVLSLSSPKLKLDKALVNCCKFTLW